MIKLTLAEVLESFEVEREIWGKGRWTVNYSVVFEYGGKFYRTDYECSACEVPEGSSTWLQDVLDCDEVEQVLVTVKEWRKKID